MVTNVYAAIICPSISTLENVDTVLNYNGIFITLATGTNAIKLFTGVIYHHSIIILPFCLFKLYYLGNRCGMAVNYHGKRFCNISPWWQT
jgi:hypothetical protein